MFLFNKKSFLIAITFIFIEIAIAIFFKNGFIRHTFGDYLVVILLYFLLRSFLNISKNTTASITLLIAFAVELVQLTPFLKALGLQNHTLANLIFGNTFSISDLLAYTLGYLTILFFNSSIYENFIHQAKHRS
ncbi:ribosomal maturation YjgA family protein [Pseudofulvibacter geojedonensis]|uniref:DUF2809 domain-containing protein n=1 Tax=Pseudofulvibacter geojedonensis TaxID=1123758 RepID=A0ABW3I552_9FLAO